MEPDTVNIEKIHESYQKGRLEYLIGAGVSIDAGLPSWSLLNSRLLELFFEHQLSKETEKGNLKLPLEPERDELEALANIFIRRFNREPVVDLVSNNVDDQDFEFLLRKALYGTDEEVVLQALQFEIAAALQPDASGHLTRLLTTNFDNLLERAFVRLHNVDKADAMSERLHIVAEEFESNENAIEFVHLHGFLPPKEDSEPKGDLVLSEQDFWSTQDNWATSLLEEILLSRDRDLLVVGMSLADPRLREVLFERAKEQDKGNYCGEAYVLLTRHQPSGQTPLAERRAHKLLAQYETEYWNDLGVHLVPVEDLKLLPMLLRQIRLGDKPQRWCAEARDFLNKQTAQRDEEGQVSSILDSLYEPEVQRDAYEYLRDQLRFVRPKFEVPLSEELTLGFFVPSPSDEPKIQLAFRYSEHPHDDSYMDPNVDEPRIQIVTPDKARDRSLKVDSVQGAQGAAGYAFVTGSLIEALHSSSHINRRFTPEMKQRWDSGRTFSSLLCVPIYGSRNWVPLGVGFLSSTRKEPFWDRLSANERLQLYALIRANFRELLGYGQLAE